jgi:hypothetical protein
MLCLSIHVRQVPQADIRRCNIGERLVPLTKEAR